jgi:hypothetical protein
MALDFPNVEVLGINQEARFFDHGTNFSNIQKISLRGNVIDLLRTQGVTGIWSGSEGILATEYNNTNFQALIVNGYNFGTGRIVNMSFSPGVDVQTKSYSANLLLYNSGNLFTFSGTFYSGIRIQNFQYLQGFSEDYNFTRKRNLGYSYSHSANIRLNSGIGTLQSIPEAKLIAQTLFTGSNLGLQFYSGFTNVAGKRFYTESYDLINNNCSFNETFDFDDYDGGGKYSATRVNSFQLDQNGEITVTENAIIRGIIYPTYQNAVSAIAGEMTGAYFRCNNLFGIYAPPASTPFINSPISQGRTFDLFNNVLTYTVTFSNKPDNFGPYFWDYTDNIQRTNGILTVTEEGTIRGKNENRNTAYTNAYNAWTTVIKPALNTRVGQFFIGAPTTGIDQTATFFVETAKDSYSPFKSQVSYSYQFSNEQFLPGTNGVKKIYVDQKDNYSLYHYNTLGIFNVDTIVQNDYQSTLGSRTISMRAVGERICRMTDYFPSVIAGLNLYIPGGTIFAITNLSYSFTPDENVFDLNATWTLAANNAPGALAPQ